jgi:hypothetical protein
MSTSASEGTLLPTRTLSWLGSICSGSVVATKREREHSAGVVDDRQRGVDRGSVVAIAISAARFDVDESGLPEDREGLIGKG